jgi:hypothetical protein
MNKRKYKVMGDRIRVSVPVMNHSLKANPLDPIQALVYGYLVFRSRRRAAVSRTLIGRSLRLDRAAVGRATLSLTRLELVREDEKGLLKALEPAGAARQYFKFREKACGEWQASFVFDRVFLPCSSRTLSVITNAVFWRLYKWGVPVDSMPGYLQVGGHEDCPVKYLKKRYLVNGLGCHRTTVSNALERLVKLGLIKICPMDGRKFAVGIPPLEKHVSLWRDTWQKPRPPVTVTARQLFGVPSSTPVKPARQQPTDGIAAELTASHIPPRLADEIMELVEQHKIPRDACRRMLVRAARKHEENQEGNPNRVEHCGYLLKKMLGDWGHAEGKRQEITLVHHYRSYDEMMAEEAMRNMRFTMDAERLIRQAVLSESLALDDEGAVPCPLDWAMVNAVHKRTGGDFARFKEEIARSIFTFDEGRPPGCRWYELWMAAKQLPPPDDAPLLACGVSRFQLRDVRDQVDEWVSSFIEGTAERIEYANRFTWLASWQARENSSGSMLDAMETLARQVRRKPVFPVFEESEESGGHLVFRRR